MKTIIFLLFLFGIILALYGFFEYCKSVIKNETHPSLGGVILFSVNTGWAAFYSQQVSNIYDSSILWTFAIGNAITLLITLFYKKWAQLMMEDWILFFITIIVFVAQFEFKNPTNAIIFACLIEGLGALMVVSKMLKNPGKENMMGWIMATLSYVCSTSGQIISTGTGANMWFSGFVVFNSVLIIIIGFYQNKKHSK